MGAIAGGGVALWFGDSDSSFVMPSTLLAGILGGMAWAAIPVFLRTRFNTNEILVTLMLVWWSPSFCCPGWCMDQGAIQGTELPAVAGL